MPKPVGRTLMAFVALVAAAVIVIAAGLPERADYTGESLFGTIPIAPEIGAQAPGFTADTLDGETITLGALRGQTVIVNFWATWCGPCRLEMPELQALYAGADGTLRILAVNLGEAPGAIRQWVDELGLTFTIVIDPAQDIAQLYHLRGQPSTYVIAPDGIITHIFYGPADLVALAEAVQ
ncbi:MAG: TlpA family protein disulfide reductase [Anaerolineaceae bacterium]|nr:TlpA family protein disulfide reductase [Anaerolineaceae bacterium]